MLIGSFILLVSYLIFSTLFEGKTPMRKFLKQDSLLVLSFILMLTLIALGILNPEGQISGGTESMMFMMLLMGTFFSFILIMELLENTSLAKILVSVFVFCLVCGLASQDDVSPGALTYLSTLLPLVYSIILFAIRPQETEKVISRSNSSSMKTPDLYQYLPDTIYFYNSRAKLQQLNKFCVGSVHEGDDDDEKKPKGSNHVFSKIYDLEI
mmetsp:Transcript_9358/g.8159  ORF Transcript_9358/g.8159 Transcript_9358/m.8159 type:complete len:211 (+) Transcript_9358:93-725(+)